MSWMKRRGQPSPNPANPGIRMFNPNQHSTVQQSYQQWQQPQQQPQPQPNYDPNNWYSQPEMEKPPSPAQSYPHQNNTNYWQSAAPLQPQNYVTSQYGHYNQHPNTQASNYYQNQGYVQPDGYQQNYSQQKYYTDQQHGVHSSAMQNYPTNEVAVQKSEDPWNWGWEDNNSNTSSQTDIKKNRNNATETSTNDESWNWTVEETNTNPDVHQNNGERIKSEHVSPSPHDVEQITDNCGYTVEENKLPEPISEYDPLPDNSAHNISNPLEQLPNATVSRIVKNENLTPQWSIESQVSQDSSEDILLTSESDNKSNIISRSSTVSHSPSRPASTHDNTTEFNPNVYKYETDLATKQSLESEQQKIKEEPFNLEVCQGSTVDNINRSLQEMSLNTQFENKEILTPDMVSQLSQEESVKHPIKEPTPPPPRIKPVLAQSTQSTPDPNKNPYKRTTTILSHSANNKLRVKQELQPLSTDTNMQNVFLQNNQQSLRHENMGVNLETLPDNSERPDQLPVENLPKTIRNTSSVQQQWIAENCEIAPINDRNQYLETGQLSDADMPVYNQSGDSYDSVNTQGTSADNNDSLPPPGLHRIVPGQIEQSEMNQPADNSDEPPPGLSRMVLGRTETEPNINTNTESEIFTPNDFSNTSTEEPPVGLHRMIPGESSSPESTSYTRFSNMQYRTNQSAVFQPANFDDDSYVSESELNQLGVTLVSQRSATIGADTPPATNQQTVAPSVYSSSSSGEPIISRVGAVGIDSDLRETDLDGANTLDENLQASGISSDSNRRDTIDGGPQEEITPLRNQTVGQNTTDMPTTSLNQQEKTRMPSRGYQTDSEHEQQKERLRTSSPNRYEKDRRYYDDRRERLKDRESPERYRDRKYDRRRPHEKRYDDETDYFSDKERNERRTRDEREEYDRRYQSLRKDKDRRRRDYDRDDRRNDYYYNRYEDEYYNREVTRSRPSSRSDSIHDSYRERPHRHEREVDRRDRNRDREREKEHRRTRDPYNPYYQGYNYDPYNPYYQQYQYQYYENLRRTNPQAYAEWYRKYYQNPSATAAYNTEDRASVHSGRSSANGDMSKDRLMDNTDSSLILEDTNVMSQRLTPAKFSTAHVKASLASGRMLNILPHYPLDGQIAVVEILNVQRLLQDNDEFKELSEFPGPLIKGISHKKTVIDYCENKIKRAVNNPNIQDVESYILMWELLILLLRQNGMVVGTDIAELLMKNRSCDNSSRQSTSSGSSNHIETVGDHIEHNTGTMSTVHNYKDEYITDKFREYLIYGSGQEALEWAMKHGLWGHALFLASKLDKRTYANVMMRFANGLTMNDPLQTLYQLLSGRQPAAVTCVMDEKWGDWRPHLAMILSNTTQRPELDRKAITTLGDTLFSRGNIYAAQFCYLMAQVEFGKYGSPNSKLVLLGSSHQKSFEMFATNEAIFMTEIYEYACTLSDASFVIPQFLPFKYLLTTRIVDHGLLEKGLLYLESIANSIQLDPTRVEASMVSKVCQLADRLKYCDPVQVEDMDSSRADTWLSHLKLLLNDFDMGLISHQSIGNLALSSEAEISEDMKSMTITEQQQQQMNEQQWQQQTMTTEYYQPIEQQNIEYNQKQIPVYQEESIMQQENDIGQEQNYWNQQQQQIWNDNAVPQLVTDEQPQNTYWNTQQAEEQMKPQITLANQSKNTYDDLEGKEETTHKPSESAKPKPTIAKEKPSSTGWFGGIWSKLALRPKNQMKLPDDKNPTIVWDSEKKRWVNLEADGEEPNTELKPPPKMSDIYQTINPTVPQNSYQNPPMPVPSNELIQNTPFNPAVNENTDKIDGGKSVMSHQQNMFKMQRARNIKKSYVDVFNPGGTKNVGNNTTPAPEVFGVVPTVNNNQMNYFVPAPITDPNAPTDFLTPALNTTEENQQLSRWSSASSLSREVQSYTQRSVNSQVSSGPMMYNPNEFSNTGKGRNH